MICLINLPLSLGNPAVMYRNCVVFHYLTRDWFRMLSIYIYRVSRYCARMTIYSINILQLFILWFLRSYICIFCQFSLLFLFYIFAIQTTLFVFLRQWYVIGACIGRHYKNGDGSAVLDPAARICSRSTALLVKKKRMDQGGCIVFCNNYIVLDIDAVNLSYADLWSHTIDDVYICGNDVWLYRVADLYLSLKLKKIKRS